MKLLRTCCVNPSGTYLGMPPRSWGLVRGLQRSTETRRCALASGMSVEGLNRGAYPREGNRPLCR